MRRAIPLWRILTMLASLAALAVGTVAGAGASALAAPAAHTAATSKFHWTPMNIKGEQAYWAARDGTPTGAQIAQWQAQVAKLPHASALPPVVRSGPIGYTTGNPSGPWTTMGPNPINAGGTNYAGRVAALAVDQTNANIIYLGAAEGGVWKTTDGGNTWTPLTDQQASMATGAITIDPTNHNTIYVGTGEPNQALDNYNGVGVLKSTDGGTHWTQEGLSYFGTHTHAITNILVNPYNSNQVFVSYTNGFESGGLAVSTDGGASYTTVGGGFPSGDAVDGLVANTSSNPITIDATVRLSGFWRSTNGGTTWSNITASLPVAGSWSRSALAMAPSNHSVLYTVIIDSDFVGNVYQPASPGPAYNGGYYSTDGGTTWHQMTSLNQNFADGGAGPQGWYDLYLGVDPQADNTLYGGGVDIAVTTNARGATGNWQNITNVYGARGTGDNNSNIHPDQHAIAFPACASAPCPAYFGNDGGIYYSNNGTNADPTTVTYTDYNTSGLGISTFTGGDLGPNFANGRLAIGGTQDDGTMVFTGNTYQPEVYGGDGGFALIDNAHPAIMYTENFGVSLAKSVDGGNTWNDGTGGGTLTGSGLFYMPYVMDRGNDQHLVAGTDSVYETANGTTTWYKSSTQSFGTGFNSISAVAVGGTSGHDVFAGTTHGALWSDTHGGSGLAHTFINADPSATLANHWITSITVDPNDATGNTVFVTTGFSVVGDPVGHIFKSTNALSGSPTWTDIAGSLPSNYPVNSSVIYYSGATRVIVVGTELGVFFTTNDGGSWTALNNGLPNANVVQLAIDSAHTTIAAFTHGRGEWRLDIPETAGGTGDTPGIFRPSDSTFFLRNSLTTGPSDESVVFGNSSYYPVAGDWNGDGIDTVGVYNSSTAAFSLKDTNTTGAPVVYHFTFGKPGDIPIVGDWTGSGHDGVGVFRPSNGIIYLREDLSTGPGTYAMVFGVPGDVPLAGDWSGQGHDTVGIYRPSTGKFYLTNTNCQCIPTANYVITFGVSGDTPFTGDWTHSGKTGLGMFRVSNGIVYLKNDATHTGVADFNLIYGIANDKPLAGHWNTAEPSAPGHGSTSTPSAKPALPTVPTTYPRAARSVNLPRQRAG
ncbi:MAG TPA: hypothetical protein VIG30_09880 [Ktedonobacterales bacterium]|jgi:hypothetical protein